MRYGVAKPEGIDIFHEVLFALSGTRSAFTSYQFAVKELFHLSEAVLLERILNLGEQYGKLKKFISITKKKQFEEKSKVGLYLLVFAEYLDRALNPYWDDVVLLEQEILNQSHNSLHFVWSRMHRHVELLSGLLSLVSSVVAQGSYGCVILQHIHQVLQCDIGVIRATAAIIIDGMNEILFRQISCWLLYGDLVDTYKEFFIKLNNTECEDDTPFKKYALNVAMLPEHIEISLAEKILKVGQTILFLRSNPSHLSSKEDLSERNGVYCIDRTGLFGEEEKKMQVKLADLREICKWNENGRMKEFVLEMSFLATTQLWTLAVQDAQLVNQLHLVNDFFLLGRGELFHEFVSQADIYLSKPTLYLDINFLLHESARKVLIKEESLQNFTLEFLNHTKDGDDSEEEWNRLLVKYVPPWPLQLLFTKEALGGYNRIFRFLLRLKKIEVKLGQCWLIEKSKRYDINNLKKLLLHRNLCFLLNNLQYYFHVDVLNSQFMILKTTVENSKNFEEIQKAHDMFLDNLSSQLFLCVESGEEKTKNPIKRSINKILELCEEYYYGLDSGVDLGMSDEKINCLLTRFDAFVEFLINHLTRITRQAIHPNSQHLLQFLLRLDFNSFFSNKFSSSLTSVYF